MDEYIPVLLGIVLVLTVITNIIVQVLKGIFYDLIPTNLLAFLVAVVVTIGTGIGVWSYYGFSVTGWMVLSLVAICFVVAFSAMFGYDKLVQMIQQAGWIKGGEKN